MLYVLILAISNRKCYTKTKRCQWRCLREKTKKYALRSRDFGPVHSGKFLVSSATRKGTASDRNDRKIRLLLCLVLLRTCRISHTRFFHRSHKRATSKSVCTATNCCGDNHSLKPHRQHKNDF